MNEKVFNIILYNPQIPPNTGNIIRLCSNTGSNLHLIRPLGFELNDKSLKRASLDYNINIPIKQYDNLDECLKYIGNTNLYFITKYGKKKYSDVKYHHGDSFMFGSENNGIPNYILDKYKDQDKLYIPMKENSRSLNLSNAVSVCVYEAWKQLNFKGHYFFNK